MSKVIGIGVGPGDPELITVKAINAIKRCDIVVVPVSKIGRSSIAFDIAKQYIGESNTVLNQLFPMTHDKKELEKNWDENTLEIEKLVKSGKTVGFLTLGDPSFYSTYMYLVPRLQAFGIEIETIPGVTSFSAVAASENIKIGEWEEPVGIVPLKGEGETLIDALDKFNNVVVMKPTHNLELLYNEIKKRELEDNFVLISKCSTDSHTVIKDVEELKDAKIPYLSTMIIKRTGL